LYGQDRHNLDARRTGKAGDVGILEPAGPLWAMVKAISDPWPLDDEVVARNVGSAWQRGGAAMANGASDTTSASANVVSNWRDSSGTAIDNKATAYAQSVQRVQQQMQTLAARGETYAGVLESAKTTITSTISANNNLFAMLGVLGPLGRGAQLGLAAAIAASLQSMIAQKAAALKANPTGAPTPPPAGDDSYGLDDLLADGLRAIGSYDQWFWRKSGELDDNVADGIAAGLGGLIRGIGNLTGNQDVVQQGYNVQASIDRYGDQLEDEANGLGADASVTLNNAATAVDGDHVPLTVYVSKEHYPESAQHIDQAQGGTSYRGDASTAYQQKQPSELTIDRDHAAKNRRASLRGIPKVEGKDLDEYPPATFAQGGAGASVKAIDSADNRGSGSTIGHILAGHNVERTYERQTRRLANDENVIVETY
jgi:hypothetical protein